MAAPKQTDPQFKLRLTPEVKAKIEHAANESGRSMNAEILWRLERSFMSPQEAQDDDIAREQNNLRERLDRLEKQEKERVFESEIETIFERVIRDLLKTREISERNKATREFLRRSRSSQRDDE